MSRRSSRQARLRLLNGADFGTSHSRFRMVTSSPTALAVSLVVVGIVLGIVHNRWHHVHRTDPLLAGASTLLYPAQIGASRVQNAASFSWDALFQGARLKRENDRLNAEVASLRQENESLRSAAAEADRLRAALGFAKRQNPSPIAAEVVGWLPSAGVDTIIVGRGGHDGVQLGAIARTPDGLVGQVTSVGYLSSEVLLLTDIASGVGALVKHNGKLEGVGIVQGTGRGQPLSLIGLRPEDDVKPGDTVITSGFGGVFPPDIPIGVVASVSEDRAHFLKSANVTPAAPLPGDIREVFLLRGSNAGSADTGSSGRGTPDTVNGQPGIGPAIRGGGGAASDLPRAASASLTSPHPAKKGR